MNETLTKRREKLFSAHSAESNFSVSKRTSVCGKYSRRMSADPALQDYIPLAPTNDEAKERNKNLPAGGIYNPFNFALYTYTSNNPIKYIDPNGEAEVYFISLLDTRPKKEGGSDDNVQNCNAADNEMKTAFDTFKSAGVDSFKYVLADGDGANIQEAFDDPEGKLVIISAHGRPDDASLQTKSNGGSESRVRPSDIKSNNGAKVILKACFQGTKDNKEKWEKAFGKGNLIKSWDRSISLKESLDFNKNELKEILTETLGKKDEGGEQ